MKNKIKKIIILLLLGVTNNLYAQEYERVNGFWNATFLDLPISDKVSIDLIPSAPPTANSIGSEISDAIIDGLAPVYLVEITTSGG